MKTKTIGFFYTTFFIAILTTLVACTDSTTEDVTSGNEQDLLFSNIEEGPFTGRYDTLGYTLLVNTIRKDLYETIKSEEKEDSLTRNKLCNDKEGGCMEIMEKYYISKASDKVKRNGKDLVLSLADGRTLTLTNNEEQEGDNYEVYQFQKLDENGYYTVAVFYYESFGYFLINAESGKSTFTIGTPVFSPDKKQYVAGNYDMVAAFTFNGLELLAATPDSAVSMLKIDFSTWGPDEVKWKDDSTLFVKQKSQPEEGPEQINYAAIRIRRHSGI
ncbi:MAG TPA: hypothetical protein VNB90_03780 [Cytophagaceae bacterium]|nr:hypothetical protein [Cytophagaceae bacterium]